jgi:voltage-gated potassium channel
MTLAARRSFLERTLGAPLVLLKRVAQPITLLLAVFLMGTAGYMILGAVEGKGWSLIDCALMTSITLTTVGYGDHLGATEFLSGQIYTMLLIVAGMGGTLYSVSAMTAFIVEGHMGRIFKEERVENRIDRLTDHTIICGAGETGSHVIEEHLSVGKPFVCIDSNEERLDRLAQEHPELLFIVGDATDEEVLERAGVQRASGLVAALSTDKDNLFLLVTARYMCPDLYIVAKCLEHDSRGKFHAAGATHVISPTFIGGMRPASQVLRPSVVDFLDSMLRGQGSARVSECVVEQGSEIAGMTIAETRINERVGLLIVAMRPPGESAFVYSPSGETRLPPGSVIVVIGPTERVQMLDELTRRPA